VSQLFQVAQLTLWLQLIAESANFCLSFRANPLRIFSESQLGGRPCNDRVFLRRIVATATPLGAHHWRKRFVADTALSATLFDPHQVIHPVFLPLLL